MPSIDFSLFAPTIAEATLIGSFSKWQDVPMTPENGTFRCSVDIPDGEHEYKFRVRRTTADNWTDVIDPYVTKYDPTRNTGLISIKDGKRHVEEFIWKHDDVKLPDNKKLIIYELYVSDFADNGQFSGVIEKLDHLSNLGINAIELMPIQESMGIAHDWGYATRNFFALKPTYGTSTDLKQLVDECHRRGIRVFIDGVFNHTAGDCPLAVIDHEYWYYKEKHHPEDPCYWGPEFNYENYDEKQNMKPACKFASDVVRYWIGEFHLDGIRFDAAKEMDNYDILRELDAAGRSVRSSQPFYSQAEYVPETPAIVKSNGGPVDSCWSASFHGIVAGVLVDQSSFNLDQMKYMISAPFAVNYLTCHDNERLLFLLGKNGNAFDDEAFKRLRLAVVLLVTSVGVPLIWQGDEFGEARELGSDDPNKKELPMQWDLMKNERNRSLFDTFKRLLELRKSRDDMTDCTANFFYEHFDDRVLAFARSQELVVVTHCATDERQGYEVRNFPQNGKWIDWLTNDEHQVDDNTLKVDLRPFDARVLILQK